MEVTGEGLTGAAAIRGEAEMDPRAAGAELVESQLSKLEDHVKSKNYDPEHVFTLLGGVGLDVEVIAQEWAAVNSASVAKNKKPNALGFLKRLEKKLELTKAPHVNRRELIGVGSDVDPATLPVGSSIQNYRIWEKKTKALKQFVYDVLYGKALPARTVSTAEAAAAQ